MFRLAYSMPGFFAHGNPTSLGNVESPMGKAPRIVLWAASIVAFWLVVLGVLPTSLWIVCLMGSMASWIGYEVRTQKVEAYRTANTASWVGFGTCMVASIVQGIPYFVYLVGLVIFTVAGAVAWWLTE